MQNVEVTHKTFILTPLAAYDEGMYAALLIVRKPDGTQRATKELGRFYSALEACTFAIAHGMTEIDASRLPEPDWQPRETSQGTRQGV